MIDKHSDTWKAVEAWAKKKLADHEAALHAFGLEPNQTEGHRYAIFELEALLKFAEVAKNVPGP